MTAGSGAGRPGAAGGHGSGHGSGHCRVTIVAPTRRVDVALPADVPLAELLPDLLGLVGDPLVPPTSAGAGTGYVLTGADGTALDTSTGLADQGVVHGGLLRLRPADDLPEAAVHDDIADAVAEAVLAGGTQWSATALRVTALAVVGVASGLGAAVLWFSGAGTFHGWKGAISGAIAALLFGLAVRRARYDLSAVGRGSYYGYEDGVGPTAPVPPSGGFERRDGPDGWPTAAARLGAALRGARDRRDHRLNGAGSESGQLPTSSFGPPPAKARYGYRDPSYSTNSDKRASSLYRSGSHTYSSGHDTYHEREFSGFSYERENVGSGLEILGYARARGGYFSDAEYGGPDPGDDHSFGADPGRRGVGFGPGSGEPVGDHQWWDGSSHPDLDPGRDLLAPAATFDLTSFGAGLAPAGRGSDSPAVGAAAVALAEKGVRDGGLGTLAVWPTVAEAMAWATGAHHRRDHAAAAVLAASSLPYAFIAGAALVPADPAGGHGIGRAHFTAGALTMTVVALAAIVGLGRRVAVPVAGVTVGLTATAAGIGLLLTKAAPVAAVSVVAALCALAVELLPFAAMVAARFVIEPPTSGVEPGDFEGSPVNNYAVGLRVVRTMEVLTGLTAGIGTLLVLCVALLVIPIDAMQTVPGGTHTAWEQALAFLVSGVVLCRARLFRERAQVLTIAISGLTGLVLAFAAMAANAGPDLRAIWLAPLLVLVAMLALGLASIRPRRGTPEPVLPPRWARAVDLVEGMVFLAVLPVLMAVLGVYGQVRGLKG